MALTVRGRPIRFTVPRINLAALRPPPMPPDGQMTLTDHLRELRYRLIVMSLAIIIGTCVAYAFNGQLFDLLLRPYTIAAANLHHQHPGLHVQPVIEGVANPFTLILKTAFIAGLVATSPITLYQIWAFIVPGLLAKERKVTLMFLGAAIPLFLGGVALAYYLIPRGIAVLIGFTPGNGTITNLLDVSNFLNFLLRVMVVFGAGFLVPVFVVGLNFAGVLKATHLAKARRFVIFGCFVFGAVATPQTDPVSMLTLAIPMTVLYLAADLIAHIHDRRTASKTTIGPDPAAGIANDTALQQLSQPDTQPAQPTTPEPRPSIADLLNLPTQRDNTTNTGQHRPHRPPH